jgi:hypothetical protein
MHFERTLVLERLAQLPEKVQRFTRSDDFCLSLADLLDRFGLQGEALNECRKNITYVITGLATKKDLLAHLTNEAHLSEHDAGTFVEDAEKLLFNPIRSLLTESLVGTGTKNGVQPPASTGGVDPYHEPVG